MQTISFQLPVVNSVEETRKIESTLSQIDGVRTVRGHKPTKIFVAVWDPPATWDEMKNTLVRMGYTPKYK